MLTKPQLAKRFTINGTGRCHNARIEGSRYLLHGHPIVRRVSEDTYVFDWCGWYSRTTANHMNDILSALHIPERVSFAQARNSSARRFLALTSQRVTIPLDDESPL